MFELLKDQPPDALLQLIKLHRDDPRTDKVDLGVGVYRDETGATPVMAAIKAAERHLLETQPSKSYLGPEGDARFVELLRPFVVGAADRYGDRLRGLQTPGGSGALRLGAELADAARPGTAIWVGTPTWPNHAPVLAAAGLTVKTYRYFDIASQTLLFDEMVAALSAAPAGDLVLLHGACHNPTGADLDIEQWRTIARLVAERGLVPFIDFAYQGLGLGLEEDARGLRLVLESVPEALLSYSCDKNFGLYRDRTGALYVLARDAAAARTAQANAEAHARVNWSMPPDHGAALVRIILDTPELTASWRAELTGMMQRINAMRSGLAAAAPSFAAIAGQRGLFSNLPLSGEAIDRLRSEHGIYMARSGRINLAGLQTKDIARVAAAFEAARGG